MSRDIGDLLCQDIVDNLVRAVPDRTDHHMVDGAAPGYRLAPHPGRVDGEERGHRGGTPHGSTRQATTTRTRAMF